MPNAALKLSDETQQLLVQYLEICYNRFGIDTARTRYERIDKAVQLEEDGRREKIESYYDDITMPVIKPPVRKISNFLIRTFASKATIFESTSSNPEQLPAVKQMNAVIEENSKTSKWAREFILFFKDLPKYNVGCIACEWVESEITTIANSSDLAATTSSVAAGSRAGNVMERFDMYNTFYDTVVAINEVSDKGDFLGHTKRYTSMRLYKYLADLRLSLGVTTLLNEDKIWTGGSQGTFRHYIPQINTKNSTQETLTPMQQLFQGHKGTVDLALAGASSTNQIDPTTLHEITILYVRIVPKIFKAGDIPSADKMQIWKLQFHNWKTLIVAEKLTNAHGIFPAILCQIDEEGISDQVKSAAELLIPMQNLQTKLYDARMQGLNRNVNDRALYNTSRIDKKHFKSDNPSAKIPVKPNILNPGLDDAYRQIPFQDNLGTTILSELGFLNQIAQRTSGLNDPQLGNFQKGNKTLGEFNEVMQNADDDLVTWANLVEVVAIAPLKYITKINILQFQANTTVIGAGADSAVQINPLELRKAAIDFKLADGLLSKETLMDMPTARGFFDLLLQSPQLQQFYGEKLPDLVDYVFSSIGFDTSQFKGQNAAALASPQPPAAGEPNAGQQAAT